MTMPETIWINWSPADDEDYPTTVGAKTVLSHINTMPYPVEYVLKSSVQAMIDAAVTEPLKVGEMYWVPTPLRETMATNHRWTDDWDDKRWLKRGLIYRAVEDAIARAKAMIGYNGIRGGKPPATQVRKDD